MVAEEIPDKLRVPPQRHRGIRGDKPPKTQRKIRGLDLAAKERAIHALELHLQGMTFEEIARTAGFASRGAAFNAIDRELDRRAALNVEKLRKIENERNQRLYEVAYRMAIAGDLWAMDRCTALSARHAKLNGLDIGTDEIMAAMPYQKRIVLEDIPVTPLLTAGGD